MIHLQDRIEIFKTNVNMPSEAFELVRRIEKRYAGYRASFDLEDCDRILRVISEQTAIDTTGILSLLADAGYAAEVLPDETQGQTALEQA